MNKINTSYPPATCITERPLRQDFPGPWDGVKSRRFRV